MAHRYSTEVKGHADFSGYWRVAKLENFDAFLQDLGFPWVVRKAALKFAGSATDVISHAGVVMKVTSLNAKGSWHRVYDTEKEVTQPNAEGVMCKTTSWWDGKVFRTKLEGSPLGPCESWRYLRNGIMVVKTSVKLASGAETSMFWYFEAMEVLLRHLGGQGRYHLLRRIERDQRQVQKATREDNRYLQRVLLNWDRWASPADEFIQVVSPSYSRARLKAMSLHAGSPHVSQGNLSKSPSASSLADMRSVEGRSGRSDVGSRSRLGSESTSALDKATIADLARADRTVAAAAPARPSAGHHTASHPASLPSSRPPSISGRSGTSSPVAGAAPNADRTAAHSIERSGAPPLPPTVPPAAQQQQRPPGEREFHREISLSYRQEDTAAAMATTSAALTNGGMANSVEARAVAPLPQSVPAAAPAAVGESSTEGGLTFPRPSEQQAAVPEPVGRHFPGMRDSNAGGVGKGTGSSIASLGPAALASGPSMTSEATVGAPSDLATMGSGSVLTEPLGVEGLPPRRVASGGSLSTAAVSTAAVAGSVRAPLHRKNLSGEGIGSDGRTSVRPTPRSTPTHRQLPTNAEQLLAFKAHEFLDSRGITAVVPVATPNDTSEPQLLCMSPEQAEQTHAKLRELEEEMLLQRQEYRKGVTCCGWFVVSWVSSSLPDHLRVWEMSVS